MIMNGYTQRGKGFFLSSIIVHYDHQATIAVRPRTEIESLCFVANCLFERDPFVKW